MLTGSFEHPGLFLRESSGNRIAILIGTSVQREVTPDLARRLHHQLGFEQLVLASDSEGLQKLRFWNVDGREVEMCTNAIRCVADVFRELGREGEARFRAGQRTASVLCCEDGSYEVAMGRPERMLPPRDVIGTSDALQHGFSSDFIESLGLPPPHFVDFGAPHLVFTLSNDQQTPEPNVCAKIETHPAFASGVNVGFARVRTGESICLEVWERSAGFTPSCGSGACAAFAVGRSVGTLAARCEVVSAGGVLIVRAEAEEVFCAGPVLRPRSAWRDHSRVELRALLSGD